MMLPSSKTLVGAMLALSAAIALPAFAEDDVGVNASTVDFAPRPAATIPSSSVQRPEDLGLRAHTNYRYVATTVPPDKGPPFSGYFFETPASLACVYRIVAVTDSCNPNKVTTNSAKGSKVIAIVDAYDDPNALKDLTAFSKQFGLPAPTSANFQVVYATGKKPPVDSTSGWEGEEALDIEMTHAMAPKAKVILVEAKSNQDSDLEVAVQKATSLVMAGGGGEVTMSYGGGEFSGETAMDKDYLGKGVVYLASTGDAPGVEYPSASPNVIAVGGTAIRTNPSTGAFLGEAAWEETGGGVSAFEKIPAYQSGIKAKVGSHRGLPDVSAIADLNTGVWVYFSNIDASAPWYYFGGTSVASPLWAGVLNASGKFSASTADEEALIYHGSAADYRDVTVGFCGPWAAYSTTKGWDFCTGNGSPSGLQGK